MQFFFISLLVPVDTFPLCKSPWEIQQISKGHLGCRRNLPLPSGPHRYGIRTMLDCMVHYGQAMAIQSVFPNMIYPLQTSNFGGQVLNKVECLYYGWILHLMQNC